VVGGTPLVVGRRIYVVDRRTPFVIGRRTLSVYEVTKQCGLYENSVVGTNFSSCQCD